MVGNSRLAELVHSNLYIKYWCHRPSFSLNEIVCCTRSLVNVLPFALQRDCSSPALIGNNMLPTNGHRKHTLITSEPVTGDLDLRSFLVNTKPDRSRRTSARKSSSPNHLRDSFGFLISPTGPATSTLIPALCWTVITIMKIPFWHHYYSSSLFINKTRFLRTIEIWLDIQHTAVCHCLCESKYCIHQMLSGELQELLSSSKLRSSRLINRELV